jgi:hypothetical protein
MNFYDGSGLTPFLPRQKIVEIISLVNDLPLEWYVLLFLLHLDSNWQPYYLLYELIH